MAGQAPAFGALPAYHCGHDPAPQPPDDKACYLALQAKDARFEDCFFTGAAAP